MGPLGLSTAASPGAIVSPAGSRYSIKCLSWSLAPISIHMTNQPRSSSGFSPISLLGACWRWVKGILPAVTVVFVTVVLVCFVLEIALRIVSPGVGFEWRNYATDPVAMVRMNTAIQYDPVLGYVHKPNAIEHGFGPIGNRIPHKMKPGDPIPQLPKNAILAAGASFTFGSEVEADESWPAIFEQITGVPVINAGVGGFALDQIFLWAKRLVPELKPRLMVVDIVSASVDINEMSVASGAPKPYYDIVDGKLVLRNSPVPAYRATVSHAGPLRAWLGYSYLADWTFDRIGLRNWWQLSKYENVYANHRRGAEIGCLLVKDLAALGAEYRIPIVMLGQYGRYHVTQQQQYVIDTMTRVFGCARAEGLVTLDLYEDFLAIHKTNPAEFLTFFVKEVGHLTPKGNRYVAEKLAALLKSKYPDLMR